MYMYEGGQPADNGLISSIDGSVKFEVSHVQKPKDCDYIQHIGKYTTSERYVCTYVRITMVLVVQYL